MRTNEQRSSSSKAAAMRCTRTTCQKLSPPWPLFSPRCPETHRGRTHEAWSEPCDTHTRIRMELSAGKCLTIGGPSRSAHPEEVREMAAVKVTKPVEEVDADDSMPEWKRLSIERSLQGPRARAQERTDRFVGAAMELMAERGSIDFTVQDVVDRSRMSIRTFYNFFASKDDLLVAVHETILATEVVPRMRCQVRGAERPHRPGQGLCRGDLRHHLESRSGGTCAHDL